MAVVDFAETWHGRGASGQAEKNQRTYTRVFKAITDNKYDGPLTVQAAIGLRYFDPYVTSTESDFGARVVKIDPKNDDDVWNLWTVTYEYSSQTPEENRSQQNPLDRSAKVSFGSVKIEVPAQRNIDGLLEVRTTDQLDTLIITYDSWAMVNTASEQPDPAPLGRKSHQTIQIVKNFDYFDPLLGFQYQDSVNNDYFMGIYPPRTVLCDDLSARELTENGQTYWEVTFLGVANPKTWDIRYLNQGYSIIVGGQQVTYKDPKTGQAPPQPIFLTETGEKLPHGGTPLDIVARWYKENPFNSMGFF